MDAPEVLTSEKNGSASRQGTVQTASAYESRFGKARHEL
jgi:hypothetical protein